MRGAFNVPLRTTTGIVPPTLHNRESASRWIGRFTEISREIYPPPKMMFLELCCGYETTSTRTVTMVLLVTHLVMITSSLAKPVSLAHRVGSADRVKRGSDGQDIPADKQVPCGRVSTCDSRTQFCDDVVNSCGSCEDDVCNPKRYGFEGAKEDCQHYCPEFWEKQEALKAAALATTTTHRPTTQKADLGKFQATSSLNQNDASRQTTQYAQYLVANTLLIAVVSFFAMFFFVVAVVQWLVFKGLCKLQRAQDYKPVSTDTDSDKHVKTFEDKGVNTEQVLGRPEDSLPNRHRDASSSDTSQPESLDSNGSTDSTALASNPVSYGPQYQTSALPGGGLTSGEVPRITDAANCSGEAGKHKAIIGDEPVCDPDKARDLYSPNRGGSTGPDGEESGLSLRSESTPEVEDSSAPLVQLSEQTAEKSRHEVPHGNATPVI